MLAAAAIGAVYEGTPESRRWSDGSHEFIRKTLDLLDASPEPGDGMLGTVLWKDGEWDDSIVLVQARILNVIGMLHSGNQNLVRFAYSGRSTLVAAAYSMDLLRTADRIYLNGDLSVQDKHREWLAEQTRIRAGFFIWASVPLW